MKNFLVALLGTLLFCGLFLALFRSRLEVGVLLLPVLLMAILIAVLCDLFSQVEKLRGRVKALEEEHLPDAAPQGNSAGPEPAEK